MLEENNSLYRVYNFISLGTGSVNMNFVSWAAFVANRKIRDKFRSFSNRSKFWNQSTEVNHEHEYKRDRHPQIEEIAEDMEESCL